MRVHIGKHILIHDDHTSALSELARTKFIADLIVADPNYKHIGDDLKTDHYESMRKILRYGHVMLHYTYNASAGGNCRQAIPHVLIGELANKGFRFKTQLFWDKYNGQDLVFGKNSHARTAPPTNVDILLLSLKGSLLYPKHVDLRILHKGSAIITHKAFQKEQFKPETLCNDIVRSLAPQGGVVLDTHMGSANLGIECIKTGRIYAGIESNAQLFERAVDKIRAYAMADGNTTENTISA